MDDMISRQAAIDALAEQMPKPYTPDGSHPADEGIFAAQEIYADCIQTLEALPPAQPDLSEYSDKLWRSAYERGKAEAQAEIIRCRNCKHNPKLEWFGCPMSHLNEKQRPETAWCWKGERRTDVTD